MTPCGPHLTASCSPGTCGSGGRIGFRTRRSCGGRDLNERILGENALGAGHHVHGGKVRAALGTYVSLASMPVPGGAPW
jgi:hypothetical protein